MADPFSWAPDGMPAAVAPNADDLALLERLKAAAGAVPFGAPGMPDAALNPLAKAIQFYGRPSNLVAQMAGDAVSAATLPGDVASGKTQIPSLHGVPGSLAPEAGQVPMQPGSLLGWALPKDARWESPGHGSPFARAADLTGFLAGGAPISAEVGAAGVFGGRLAKTADLEALKRAESMKAAGAYSDDIWRETGWFQGADKKWRFEIPDNAAKFNADAMKDKEYKVFGKPIMGREGPMGEVLNHPELYAAYPDLAQTQVGQTNYHTSRGTYHAPSSMAPEMIGIEQSLIEGDLPQARSTMLHEVQHAIQQREKFAGGLSPTDYAASNVLNPERQIYNRALSESADLSQYRSLRASPDYDGELARSNALWKEKYQPRLDAIDAEYRKANRGERDGIYQRSQGVFEDFRKETAGMFPTMERVDELSASLRKQGIPLEMPREFLDPHEAYRRTAGEVEARNVQTRADYPPDKRRDVPPEYSQDVQYPSQFIHQHGELSPAVSMSMRDSDILPPSTYQKLPGQLEMPGLEPPGSLAPRGQVDLTHLNALELGLSHERDRLAKARTPQEREQRGVWVAQREKEIAQEKQFLAEKYGYQPPAAAPDAVSLDDLARELGDFTLGSGATDAKGATVAGGLNAARAGAGEVPGSFAPIRAYHGSPYDFDRFDMAKINTGEGAQSYGHGLYFAENPKVAEEYKKNVTGSVLVAPRRSFLGQELVSGTPEYHAGTLLSTMGKTLAGVRKEVRGWIENAKPGEDVAHYQAVLDTLNRAGSKADFKELPRQGRMYEVNLNAPADRFLDWDKPLSAQPDFVQPRLRDLGVRDEAVSTVITRPEYAKRDLPWADEREASRILADAGIPGIKYLDQGSRFASGGQLVDVTKGKDGWVSTIRVDRDNLAFRGPGTGFTKSMPLPTREAAEAWARDKIDSGTRNFVVFDPSIIDIVRKYAIPGTVAAGSIFGSFAPDDL